MGVTVVKGSSENMWVTDGGENPVTDDRRNTQYLFHPDLYRKNFCTYRLEARGRLGYVM